MTPHSAWLAELHRQWYAARGKKLGRNSRAFVRPWGPLLDAAGITSAEECATALREAAKLHDEGRLALVRNKYRRYLVERVAIPLSSESWLRDLFESPDPEELRQASIETIRAAEDRVHPRFPSDWSVWLASLRQAFEAGRNRRPLFWSQPVLVGRMLDLTFRLTAGIWSEPIFIREMSVALGLPSKTLERSRRIVESCLGSMFGRPFSLEMFGVAGSQPRIEIAGELTLHFHDGESQRLEELQGSYHLTSDLMRATGATTPAKRILTIENSKTTLRRIASLNGTKETLILAGAYPGQGLLRLIELLPHDLPVYHFGDTDPAGFLILSKLRKAFDRPVLPFLMERRVSMAAMPLTGYDRSILPALLDDPLLADVRPHLEEILISGDKGSYEQEALGIPDLSAWPFYRCHPEAGCK